MHTRSKRQSWLYETLPEALKLEISTKSCVADIWRVITDRYNCEAYFVQAKILGQMQQLCCKGGRDP